MAGEIYIKAGTTVVFGSEVGDDVAWTTENISAGAGCQSAQHDLGDESTTARADEYRVRFYTQVQATTPAVGETVDVYFKTSDSSTLHLDNDDGTGDIALSNANKLKNLMYVGSAVVDEAAADKEFVMTSVVRLSSRYVHAVLYNNTGASITNDAAETKLELTPIYYQSQ